MIRRAAKRVARRLARNDYQPLNRIELNRARLLANAAYLQELHPTQQTIAVIKANAYGHGLAEVADILNGADCAFVAVDGYFEAARVRDITRHRILVMGYIKPQNVGLLDTKRCSFVVQDTDGLRAFGRLNRPVRVHMELNSGMNRLGLQPDEIGNYLDVLRQYPKLQLEGVMTHLADADNPKTDAFTERQIELFDHTVERLLDEGFRPSFFHAAQTAGSTKARSRYANAVRLGIGLYGVNPLRPDDKRFGELQGLRPVLSLKSTIIKIYDLEPGDRVSYNGVFEARASRRVGVLPLGYYEGLPRDLSNRGAATATKRRLPIVGTVCMDHTMIDITGTKLAVGDEVTVINADPKAPNSIQAGYLDHNIFPYDWMAGLSDTIRRVIV